MRIFDLRMLTRKHLKPLTMKLLFRDVINFKRKVYSSEFHLQKAIDWLVLAQKITMDGGVSKGYSLMTGWGNSYMETSGYILVTFLDYFISSNNQKKLKMCREIADWECSIQMDHGGYRGGVITETNEPGIFITGQVIHGLLKAYEIFNDEKYLETAKKAGNFLTDNQDPDGAWSKFCFRHSPETFNTRSAWSLLRLYKLTNKMKFKVSAIKNLEWAITQTNSRFWFNNNDSFHISKPLLHFISYTIRGFLESGLILNNEKYINIALNTAIQLLNIFNEKNWLPATFDKNWRSQDRYSCLAGDAQLSIIWLKLYQQFKDKRFLLSSLKLNNYLKTNQVLSKRNPKINGAVKGSDPIWGNYSRFKFPNWGTKFFCDSLLLETRILKEIDSIFQ